MYSELPKSELASIAKDSSSGLPFTVELTELWIVEGKGRVETWQPVVKLHLDGSVV